MNEKNNAFHYVDRRYTNLLRRFKADKTISEVNKTTMRKYLDSLHADGLSKPRIIKCFDQTLRVVKWLDKDLGEVDKDDVVKLLSTIHQMNYSEASFADFKVSLKRFYKWFKGNGEEYPDFVRWVKTTLKQRHITLPEELLSEKEVKRIIDYSMHPRDRALFALMWETGARIGEIGNAKLKSVSFHDGEAEIVLTGKTGSRKVLLISSVPYLRDWCEMHPDKENKEAALFVLVGSRGRGLPMTYAACRKVLKQTMQRAGIKKAYNPHLWRHSRATYLANFLTEAQLCKVMGWVIGSKEVRTYVSLSLRDTREAIRRVHGKAKKEEEKVSALTPVKCSICKKVNKPGETYCSNCGNPLSMEVAVKNMAKVKEFEDTNKKATELLQGLIEQIQEMKGRITELENGSKSLS